MHWSLGKQKRSLHMHRCWRSPQAGGGCCRLRRLQSKAKSDETRVYLSGTGSICMSTRVWKWQQCSFKYRAAILVMTVYINHAPAIHQTIRKAVRILCVKPPGKIQFCGKEWDGTLPDSGCGGER